MTHVLLSSSLHDDRILNDFQSMEHLLDLSDIDSSVHVVGYLVSHSVISVSKSVCRYSTTDPSPAHNRDSLTDTL